MCLRAPVTKEALLVRNRQGSHELMGSTKGMEAKSPKIRCENQRPSTAGPKKPAETKEPTLFVTYGLSYRNLSPCATGKLWPRAPRTYITVCDRTLRRGGSGTARLRHGAARARRGSTAEIGKALSHSSALPLLPLGPGGVHVSESTGPHTDHCLRAGWVRRPTSRLREGHRTLASPRRVFSADELQMVSDQAAAVAMLSRHTENNL